MSMDGRVVAITGGASGIGLATAQIISQRGATVAIGDVDPASLKTTEEYFQSRDVPFMITRVDVSKRIEVDSWINSIVDKYGRLDGAANCAGIIGKHHGIRTVAEIDDEEWHKLVAVNLTGMMYCLRAELGKIVDGGSIVNVASIQGIMGFADFGAYSATKHGIVGLSRAAAKENGHRGIRVNVLAPGSIRTPLMAKSEAIRQGTENQPQAIPRMGTAEEIGFNIAFLLGPESTFTTGAVHVADGGWAC